MGNSNCTTGSSSMNYSRLRSSHYSHSHEDDDDDDDDSLGEPLLQNFTQRLEEQQRQLLHQIHEVNHVKETTKSINMPSMKEQKPYNHHAVEKELQELRVRVAKLETSCPSRVKQGEAIEKIKKKNATLEKQVLQLTATVDEMKRTKTPAAGSGSTLQISTPIPDLIDLQTPVPSINNPAIISEVDSMTPVPQSEINNGVLIDDLTGCLIVLIFLVGVLIGVLL